MGNITAKNVGDFQADVGNVSADINLLNSYMFAGLMGLVAIIFAVIALIKTDDSSNFPCSSTNKSKCKEDEDCIDGICKGKSKPRRHYLLLIGSLICILIGVGVVMFMKATAKAVHNNRNYAQLYGAWNEAEAFNKIL